MNKQDRQGVRKPSDLEQRYDLASIPEMQNQIKALTEKIAELEKEIALLKA